MGGTHTKSRRRSRIETELPIELRQDVDRLLLEGATYEEIAEHLKVRGYNISRASIGRYGKEFFEAYGAIKRFEDQARAITAGAADGMPMEEAVGKMILQKVMAGLMDGTANVTENARLISGVASLQNAHVRMNVWKDDLEKRAKKTADAVAKIVKKGGLSDDAADKIRAKILGMAT